MVRTLGHAPYGGGSLGSVTVCGSHRPIPRSDNPCSMGGSERPRGRQPAGPAVVAPAGRQEIARSSPLPPSTAPLGRMGRENEVPRKIFKKCACSFGFRARLECQRLSGVAQANPRTGPRNRSRQRCIPRPGLGRVPRPRRYSKGVCLHVARQLHPKPLPEAAKMIDVAEQAYYRGKKKYGGLRLVHTFSLMLLV